MSINVFLILLISSKFNAFRDNINGSITIEKLI